MTKFLLVTLLAVLFNLANAGHAFAGAEGDFAQVITDEGEAVVVGGAILLPLIRDGKDGEGQALRTGDAVVSTALATIVLKNLVREERPDLSGHDSFPSGHTSAAFAAATIASHYSPGDAPYWYGGAALVGWSRVRLNKHRVRDVAAGALLGYGMARLELKLPRGMLMSPFVSPTGDGEGVELSIQW